MEEKEDMEKVDMEVRADMKKGGYGGKGGFEKGFGKDGYGKAKGYYPQAQKGFAKR